MFEKKDNSILNLALLTAIVAASQPLAVPLVTSPGLAQIAAAGVPTAFPLPTALPTGTTVRIDGSSSMATANQALKQRFETQFPGTRVTLGYDGTPAALKAVLDGKTDIAAIGRSLTPQEKAQGLTAVPVSRDKIAIVIGANNPFNGSLTSEQFAKIFRGEITDWSEVGGAPGKIRVLDRPELSDTRQAFRGYPVFKAAPFTSGSTTTRLSEDSTATVISQLQTDGIGYAIASQAREAAGLKVLPMHNTLPTDPRYPFSQPLVYVYKGSTPSPAIAAFLSYASAPDAPQTLQSAQFDPAALAAGSAAGAGAAAAALNVAPTATIAPTPSTPPDSGTTPPLAATPTTPATAPTNAPTAVADARSAQVDGGIPPWLLWLLPLGLLGLFLWWFKSRRSPIAEPAESPIEPVVAPRPPIAPDPTVVPPATDLIEPAAENPNLAARAGSVINSDRAAIADQPASEISDPRLEITSPTAPDSSLMGAALAAGAGAAAWADQSEPSDLTEPPLISSPPAPDVIASPSAESASASPIETSVSGEPSTPDSTLVAGAALAGGAALGAGAAAWTARSQDTAPDVLAALPDVATSEDLEIEAVLSTFDTIDQLDADLPIATTDTPTELNLDEATSASELPETGAPIAAAGLVGGAALAAGAAAWMLNDGDRTQLEVEAAKFDVGQTDLSRETLATVDEGLPDLPAGYGDSRIVLLPRDPQWGYTYWDVSNEHKSEVRQQGGQSLVLRLYDVTDIEVNHQTPHSMQQFDCDEMARDWYLAIPVSDRDYLVEIGYLTQDGRWLMLARSLPARIPPTYPSDWFEEQFVTIDWQEDLRSKTFLELVPPSQRTEVVANPIYDQLFGMAQSAEAQRVVGSLFGSMQQVVTQQSISSFGLQPGVGFALGELPTLSGIGMSGIGMSGIGMSGIGLSASAAPIRPRNFWLVADAELIVYGATEPDAEVTIDGTPITLNPDGTFRFQVSFQDGVIHYPIIAVAADGEQLRSIHMKFTRETPHRHTNTKNEAQDEWLF